VQTEVGCEATLGGPAPQPGPGPAMRVIPADLDQRVVRVRPHLGDVERADHNIAGLICPKAPAAP